MKKNVAIIPARGGSKRIQGKNIKGFCGKPIIAYSIATALKSGLFDQVIVSTDSVEIAEIAKQYGAEVPFMRPPELADDHCSSVEVLLHDINWLEQNGRKYDYACMIYATAPFLQISYLQEGFDLISTDSCTSAFSVTSFSFPIFRAMKITENGCINMFWPEYKLTRSQDLPKAFHDAGQFYWVNTKKFIQKQVLFADDSKPVILPDILVQDIDTPDDWEYAELKYKTLQRTL